MKTCILPSLVVLALFTLAAPLYCQTPDDLNPGADDFVYATAIQPDGKIVVGGTFTTLDGQPRSGIGRLNADGVLDPAFNPGAGVLPYPNVHCLAVQADGKIVVGGYFTTLGGQPRNYIGRLNPDGTLDTDFNPGVGSYVYCLAIQPDGKILVGGPFSTLAGVGCNYLGRLNADGTVDTDFAAGADSWVNCVACQPDGKILVAGFFTTLGGQPRRGIARLNSNGTADLGFNSGTDYAVSTMAMQADGRIVVGGTFSTLDGQPRSNLGRLMADGTLDPSLNQGAEGGTWPEVLSVAVQSDGKILVGGYFTTLAGQPRSCVGRLNSTDPATQSLTCDASTITWLRGGVSPEVTRTSFEASSDGTNWASLGPGTRISGGWQLAGIPVPTNALIRALGYVTGGYYSGSDWMVQTILAAPRVFGQPVSLTNSPDSVATFSVLAGGVAPLSYQWFKDAVNSESCG